MNPVHLDSWRLYKRRRSLQQIFIHKTSPIRVYNLELGRNLLVNYLISIALKIVTADRSLVASSVSMSMSIPVYFPRTICDFANNPMRMLQVVL